MTILRQWYKITTTWDYEAGKVTLSMPGYVVDKLLRELNHHPMPRQPQHSPHPQHIPIQYGPAQQLATGTDQTAPLSPTDPYQPAQIVGRLLYYARAIDSTLNVALSTLAAKQNKPTMQTEKKIIQLLDYCATHPDARVEYRASDMVLHVHSDAGYTSKSGARSRAGGHFFLGNKIDQPNIHNGAILNPTHILKHVATSAADAEIGAAFVNCKESIPTIRITLEEMGHPQPPTPVTIDNTTAVGLINKQMKQRQTKAIGMRYYWLQQDQEAQSHFRYVWDKGENNRANYFTKHHAPAHHQMIRPQYVSLLTHGISAALQTMHRRGADPRSPQWKPAPAGNEADMQAQDSPMTGCPVRARFAEPPHKIWPW